MTYRVEGGRELRRTLRQAGDDLENLKDTHRQVGTFVSNRARERTPSATGRLGATGRPGATKTAALVRFGGARAPYARFVHWGTRLMRARPWVTEAAQASRQAWETMYQQGVNRVLARIKGA